MEDVHALLHQDVQLSTDMAMRVRVVSNVGSSNVNFLVVFVHYNPEFKVLPVAIFQNHIRGLDNKLRRNCTGGRLVSALCTLLSLASPDSLHYIRHQWEKDFGGFMTTAQWESVLRTQQHLLNV